MEIDPNEAAGANRSWTIFVVTIQLPQVVDVEPRFQPSFPTMFQVTVVSTSGRSESLSLPLSSKVGDLKISAQRSFQQGFLRLITTDGRILGDPTQSLLSEGFREEECLTAVVLQAKLAVSTTMGPHDEGGSFALWCCGGNKIITWGHQEHGGDSSAVQDQLHNVQQVRGTQCAFAAILADGSVVTWGHQENGGGSSALQDQLPKL